MKKQFTNKARYLGLKLTAIIFALLLFVSGQSWGQTTLAGWDMNGQTNFGTSPLTASTIGTNVTVGQLTKGSGILGGGTAAGRAWGGGTSSTWNTSSATSISNGAYASFTIKANNGYLLSLSSINPFDYRRSSSGPPTGLIQYQINSGSFVDITTVSFTVTTSAGGSISSIDLSGVTALQNLTESSIVTFRIVPFGASPGGTWYIFDKSNSTANDFSVNGTVSSAGNTAPTVTTQAATSIFTTTATGNGNITATGGVSPTARGFCWDLAANADPDIADSKVEETGTFSTGAYTGSISGLTAGTQYKVRAYATNSVGTSYGSVQTFYSLSNEPSNHVASFSATANSQTQITTTWLDNDGGAAQAASGFLVLANTSGTFTDPVDGIAQSDGALVKNITHGIQTAVFSGLTAGTPYFFKIFPYNGTGTSINYKTDITVPTASATTLAPLASTSEVSGPALGSQPNPILISSLTTADAAAVRVLDMDVYDYGVDTDPTKITQITIKAGTNNTANWANTIQGVKLSTDAGSSFVTIGTPIINATSIVIPVTSGNLNIPNSTPLTLSLYVFLKSSGLTDNSILEFKVDATAASHGFTADATGSTFLTTFATAPVSNQILVDVVATKLAFVQQPTNVGTSANISAAVTVSANDVNGNRDLNYVTNVSVTATGATLTGSPVVVAAVSGLATFSTLSFANAATGVTLDAASGSLTGATSSPFNITLQPAAGEVVINQFNPGYNGTSNEYIELVNRTNKTFDLSQLKIMYSSATGSNPNSMGILSGTLLPYSYWLLSPDATITVGLTSALARDGSFTAGMAAASGQIALETLGNTIIDGVAYGTITLNKLGEGSAAPTPATAKDGIKRVSEGIDNNANSTDFVSTPLAGIYLRNHNSLCIASNYILPATSYPADVVISGSTPAVTLSGNTTIAGKLTIQSGSLTVASTQTLTVTGTLTNSAGNTGLVLKSDTTGTASLITSSSVGATVERYITHYTSSTDGWRLVSSPIGTTAIGNFLPGTNDDFYGYDEANNLWLNYKVTPFGFTNGLGYLSAYETSATKSFSGALNTADITIANQSLTPTKGNGWQLLGNPFTSAIKWNDGNWALSNVNTTAKRLNSGGTYSDLTADDIIPAMQGFFVQVSSATNSIKIPAASRTHSSANILNKSSVAERLDLKVSSIGNNTYVEATIKTNANATTGFDALYDANFLAGMYGAPQLYSIITNNQLSTNTIAPITSNLAIPMGFVAGLATNYKITADGLSNFTSCSAITLEDLKTNTTQNLMQNPVYNFTATTTDNANRFVLHFATSVGVNEIGKTNGGIYAYDNNIYVNTNEQIKQISVYNAMGQLIKTVNNVNGLQKINMNGNASGYYIVKVICDKNVYSEKVLIK